MQIEWNLRKIYKIITRPIVINKCNRWKKYVNPLLGIKIWKETFYSCVCVSFLFFNIFCYYIILITLCLEGKIVSNKDLHILNMIGCYYLLAYFALSTLLI